MNIRDRLMSRASVAAMAVFAPKEPGADFSKIGQPENVDAGVPDAGGRDALTDLSPEEQAQFDAMQAGQDISDGGNVDAGADGAAGDGDGDGADGDGEADGDAGEAGAADRDAGDGAPADGQRTTPRTVSYGKHQRELAKAKKNGEDLQARLDAATKDVASERELRARLDERTKVLLEAIQTRQAPAAAAAPAQTAPADVEPDEESDPIGYAQWKIRGLEKIVNDLSGGIEKTKAVTAAEREEQEVYRAFESDIQREAAADPAFPQLFAHLRESRYTELGYIFAGVDINDKAAVDAALTPEQQIKLSENIQRTFYNEQLLVTRQALQQGKSPAKTVANLARARGFKPAPAPDPAVAEAAAAAAARAAAAPAGGAAPAVRVPAARAAPQGGSVKDELAAIRANQQDAVSLSDAGGAPGGAIDPKRLAEMSDAEFQDFYDRMPKEKMDALMGKVPM